MSEHFPADSSLIARNAKPRVALLVDGENLSSDLAGMIIREALTEGEIVIRRVYGDARRLPKWTAAPGFRVMHSGSGKNATDLLLTVEAMALMLGRYADVLCLAASDGDYTHLATHLRESGIRVVGFGEKKSSERLRKSFSRFRELTVADPPKAAAPSSGNKTDAAEDILENVVLLIGEEGGNDGFSIVKLSGRMHALHKTRITTLPEKSWRAFLSQRSEIFDCDPKGPEAKVRLRKRPA